MTEIEPHSLQVLRAQMAETNVMFRRALRSGNGPLDFLWTEPVGVAICDVTEAMLEDQAIIGRRLARLHARDEMAERRRVSRDPCPRCGTRADIGCQHRRVA